MKFLFLFLSLNAMAQDPAQLREELHRRIREFLINGQGTQDAIFKDMDKLFDGSRFRGMGGASTSWEQTDKDCVLMITPQKKDDKLEIDVKDGMVHIKKHVEQKSQHSSYVSSSSQSFSVPSMCDSTKVKSITKEGKIMMIFPYKPMK